MPRNFKTANDDMMAKKMSDNIKTLMKRKGLRQIDLSDKTGIKRSTISNYVNGKTIIPMVALQRIANALGVTKSEIVELDESKTIEVIGIKKVPVYDAIKSEFGSTSFSDPIEYIDTPFSWISEGNFFYINVKDNSMPGIFEGHKVLVMQTSSLENGDMALVSVNNEIMIRRIYKDGNSITLDSIYKKDIIDDRKTLFSIIGRVKKVIGDF
ncbi:TPA: helix-turn-helix domain-containing protein [Bacillus thuringiensis]|nr:helix-turn-helix domain-containing protein [Bacillus thuringiensis]HDR3314607.1 helix-turn-helix domain-containing protein [Bacillus thuringiensis]